MAAEVEVARGAISIELESRILKQISDKIFITKAFHSEPRTYILPPDHRCRRGWVAGQEFLLRCKSLLASVVLIKDISYIHLFGTTKNWHNPRVFFCVGTRFHCPATQPLC